MVRVLYVVSILCVVAASFLFGLCGVQWIQRTPPEERDPWIPATERLRLRQSLNNSDRAAASPLLEQAQALALYLSPAKPPPRQEASLPGVRPASVSPSPAPRPPSPTPQFRILAISYYRSDPQKSLAMVWDANKGGHWVKQGDHLGHFVVERIEKEAVIYRDGDQLRQMAVAVKPSVPLAKLKSKEAASMPEVAPEGTLARASP